MKPKTVILLVVAVGCGLVASYMTSRVIAERQTTQEVTKVPVIYAIKNVPQNRLITNPEEFFEQRMVPEELAPKNRPIRELSQLAKKRLVNPIGVDKYVCEDDVLGNDASGMTYRVPQGMRAVSVRVSQDISVGGFVMPGYHVDILCVPNGRNECNTILQRVLVLAVNAQERRPEDGKANLETNIVTFAVSPDDANKLALATFSGNLRLTLRHIDDDKVAATRVAKADDLARPTYDASDAEGDTGTTQQAPIQAPPTTPAEPTRTEPAKIEPPQPKLLWVMNIRNSQRVEQVKFFDEPPIAVEKRDPETGRPVAPTPMKKETGGATPPQPTSEPPATNEPNGKK